MSDRNSFIAGYKAHVEEMKGFGPEWNEEELRCAERCYVEYMTNEMEVKGRKHDPFEDPSTRNGKSDWGKQ